MEIPADWVLLIKSDEILAAVDKIAAEVSKKFLDQKLVVVCLLKGAAYFTVDLTRKLTIPHSLYFIKTNAYDGQELMDEVTISSDIVPKKFVGKKVLIVDELLDTGETLKKVKDTFLTDPAFGLTEEDITTCVSMRKKKDSISESSLVTHADIVGIDLIPDIWLTGYGLDANEHYRHLIDIYATPKVKGLTPTNDDKWLFNSDGTYCVESLNKFRRNMRLE